MAMRMKNCKAAEDSAEYKMGKIEAQTYAKPAYAAGHSKEEAASLTIERGLYPHWLDASELASENDQKAHAAWMKGIEDEVNSIYKKPPTVERTEVKLRKNALADKRAAELKDSKRKTVEARREAITNLKKTSSTTQKAAPAKPAATKAQNAKA